MDDRSGALSPFGVKTLGFTAQDLTPQGMEFLRSRGTVRHYKHGVVVQGRTSVPPHASWLLQGRLRCVGKQAHGAELHGGWIMPQEVFGVNCVLLGCGSRFDMVVDTPQAEVLHFSREVLLELMALEPDAGVGVCIGLSRRLAQQMDMINVAGQRTLLEKLRAVLYWWSKSHGIAARDGSVELWVPQNELAVGIGASRQRVHFELQHMRASGELELGYRKVILRRLFFENMARANAPH